MNPNTPAPAHMLIVQLSREELRELIRDAVRAEREVAEQPASPSEWVDVKAGADILKCHPRTLARLAQSGVIPSSRIGNRLRFRRISLEAHLSGGAS